MKKEVLEKFCSQLNLFSIRELAQTELKDNFYELQKQEQYFYLLNSDEKNKEEFDQMMDLYMEELREKDMVLKDDNYIYIIQAHPRFKEINQKMRKKERRVYLDLIHNYIELNTKKHDPYKIYKH